VDREKHGEQIAKGKRRRIEGDAHHFGVAGAPPHTAL
jgi:hypothetical protein